MWNTQIWSTHQSLMNVPSWPTYRATIMRSKELNRLTLSHFRNHNPPTNHTNHHTTITEIMWLNRSTLTAHNNFDPTRSDQKKNRNKKRYFTKFHTHQDIYKKNYSKRWKPKFERALPFVFLSLMLFSICFFYFAKNSIAVFSVDFWQFSWHNLLKSSALPNVSITDVFLWWLFHNTDSELRKLLCQIISNSNS